MSQLHSQTPADQTEEMERLRAEVATLRDQLASRSTAAGAEPGPPMTGAAARGGWWRTLVASILILTAAVLAPLSVVARWAHDEVSDTDRYVETITPLAHDPAVQNAIVTRVTDEIFTRIDVQAVTQEAIAALSQQGLRPRASEGLSALSAPLAGGIRSFVTTQVTRLVQSDAFADAWVTANREAHTQLVAVLSGEGTDAVSVDGGKVTLNLAPLIETVKDRLSAAGFTLADRLPEVNAKFTIFQSENLAKGQAAFRLLDAVARWLPVIALLLLAVAVFLARNRRKALIWSAVAVATSMVLLGAALNIFRPVYLNAIDPDTLPTDAAAAVYDQLVEFIRLNLRAVLVVALAVAAVAWVTGPGGAAARRGMSAAVGSLRGSAEHAGLRTGPVGAFAYRWRSSLRGAIAGGAALIYLLEDHPTGASALTLLVIAAVALLLLEFLARPPVDVLVPEPPAEVTTSAPV